MKGKTETWEERFKQTRFAKEGGSSFEASDYEGMYDDLLKFISTVYQQGRADEIEEVKNIQHKGHLGACCATQYVKEILNALHQSTREK